MSNNRTKAVGDDFLCRLAQLRSRVDSLPEQHQTYLRPAVDEAERQHNRMQDQCAKIRDMDADLGLSVEYAKFHVAACRRELQLLDPQGHFQL